MRIEWNGKRAIVTYDDSKKYNGEYNLQIGCEGIGTLYDADGTILHRGIWANNNCVRELTEEEYNRIRTDW